MSSGSVRWLSPMLCTSPGSPRKWSPWKWVRKIRRTRMNEAEDWKNCRWVPSPQSRSTSSFSRSRAMALAERSFVGQEPAVPRKVRRIGGVGSRAPSLRASARRQRVSTGAGMVGPLHGGLGPGGPPPGKGWDWSRIAEDDRVGFAAEESGGDAGRQLRTLYYQRRSKAQRRGSAGKLAVEGGSAGPDDGPPRLLKIGYAIAPLFAIWAALALVFPSPVGVFVPGLDL